MTIEDIEELIDEYESAVHSCAIDYIAGPITIKYGEQRIQERDSLKVSLIEAIKKYGAQNDN